MALPVPHILVVDDEPSVREALTAALDGAYVVHGAVTGDEACAVLRTHPIAAIILDAILEDEHGLDLVGRFRTLSRAPILILTGYGTEELAVRALRAKASDYLKKPVSVRELRAALARLIQPDDLMPDLATRVRQFLDAHPAKPFRAATMAAQLGMSEAHLRRLFRETYGKTPRRYVTEARIRRAAELLRTSKRGIKQIAMEVGYTDLRLFRRTFARLIGMTPLAWRARGRKGGQDRVRGESGCPE